MTSRTLQCTCGHVRGRLNHPEKSTRITCYCKDCRAFAHYLGRAGDAVDAQGGVDVLVSHPQEIVFDSGADALACMSLSDEGMLRWYASCCNTPIGNTARNKKLAYVGLSAVCLADPALSLDSTFGPPRMRSFTESAKGKVAGSGIAALPVFVGFGVALLGSRLSGSYQRNPFFKPGTDDPVAAPTVLTPQERDRLGTLDGAPANS